MENAWKYVNKKKGGKKDILALEDKILWEKIRKKKTKIGFGGLVKEREQNVFWKVE